MSRRDFFDGAQKFAVGGLTAAVQLEMLRRMLGAVFWSAIRGVAIYPVLRDAKSLANAAGPSQTTYANGCGRN
jgi:hypothetical protein